MKILHITPHMGGGVGTVIMGWVGADKDNEHRIYCLDSANWKSIQWATSNKIGLVWKQPEFLELHLYWFDVVVVHYWDHPFLADLFAYPIPESRMVFYCHKNIPYTPEELSYPDRWIDTSPIQGHGEHIWSTGGVDRFLEIKPKVHEGFNIGYIGTVDWKKIHPRFFSLCDQIMSRIPEARFTVVGEQNIHAERMGVKFTGKVDDVSTYLAEFDVFGYPLRSDHYGTCEQVLGEAMAAGLPVMVFPNPAEKVIIGKDAGVIIADWEDDSKNTEEYVTAIKMISEQTPKMAGFRKEIGACNRTRAKELYSLDTMIQAWNKVFEEMMEKPKSVRRETK